MNLKKILPLSFIASLLIFTGCGDDDDTVDLDLDLDSEGIAKTAVVENYANIVYANYTDALELAEEMETAIAEFVADPSETSLEAARTAWYAAREPYGLSEAFRFSNGPIDNNEDAPEGLLNSWPLDENYIDYVDVNFNAGIVNNTTDFPMISAEVLANANQTEDIEANVSIGYHAVEFLLWGQDLEAPSALTKGNRPYTDYVAGDTPMRENAVRRGQYLNACASLIVDLLEDLQSDWNPSGINNFRSSLLAQNANTSINEILQAIGIFAQSELGGERIAVALGNRDQEDEHSCFSDNTHRDIITNITGVRNVFTGSYTALDGTVTSGLSIADLVREADEAVYTSTMEALNLSVTAAEAIPVPFDNAISDDSQRPLVQTSFNSLQDLGDQFVLSANALGFAISTDLPE